jgi:hypothetical protein
MPARWSPHSELWRYTGFRSRFFRGIAASRASNTRTPSNQWEDADLNLAAGNRPIKNRLETGRARYRLGWVLAGSGYDYCRGHSHGKVAGRWSGRALQTSGIAREVISLCPLINYPVSTVAIAVHMFSSATSDCRSV